MTFELLCMVQGAYFLATGIWPLISIDTFQKVTGPKTDLWLVRTVGILVGVVGAVILSAGMRGRHTLEIAGLAVGCAAGLTIIDVVYVLNRTISRIYLVDAVAEVLLIVGWGLVVGGGQVNWEE